MKLVRSILWRAALVLFGVLLAAAALEVGLRMMEPGLLVESRRERSVFCRFDGELGWAPLEDVTAIHRKDGQGGVVHQNQYGMRGPDDVTLQNRSGKRRVLVLGDSYVWGYAVAQNQLFSAPEVHGASEEILNFGVSGYGTDQEYLLYLRRGARFEVDEVVLAFTPSNDVRNNLASRQYGYAKPYFTLEGGRLLPHTDHIRNEPLRRLSSLLRRHSCLWNRLGDLSRTFLRSTRHHRRRSEGGGRSARALGDQQKVTDRDRRGVALTIAILRSLRDAVVAHGTKFSVIFVPYKRNVEAHLPGNHPLVRLIAEGLQEAGIDYREPYPDFLRATLQGAHLFNDRDNHFSPAGHVLFGKFLVAGGPADSSLNSYARQ